MRSGRLASGVFAAALLVMCGCVPTFESEESPTRIYWLHTAPIEQPHTKSALRVAVVPGLESDRIWILQRDHRLNYYAGAHWPDSLGTVLQSVMERSIGHLGSASADVSFDVLVERFFAVETADGEDPRIELRARISRSDAAAPTCVFNASSRPSTARLRDIVAAHQTVLDRLTEEVERLASLAVGERPYACPSGESPG